MGKKEKKKKKKKREKRGKAFGSMRIVFSAIPFVLSSIVNLKRQRTVNVCK